MRPEHAAQRGKGAVGKAFEQTRMVPEFELDNVGHARQPGHMIEPVGDDDARPAGFNHLRVTTVAGLLEQEKGLLHRLFRQVSDISACETDLAA